MPATRATSFSVWKSHVPGDGCKQRVCAYEMACAKHSVRLRLEVESREAWHAEFQ